MGFVLRAASQSQSATRRRPLNAMSSKAQQRPFGAWSTHQQSQQTPLFCFLCVVEPVELQFFLGGRQCQLMGGPGFELWTSCTGRANATHTPPRQNTLAALTESSCRRRVQHGSGELLAPFFSLTSHHRLALTTR